MILEPKSKKLTFLVTFITGFGLTVLTTIVSVLSVPISLAYWGQSVYGILALFVNIVTIIGLSNLGLNSASNYFVGKESTLKNKEKVFLFAFKVLSIIIATIVTVVGTLLLLGFDLTGIIGNIPNSVSGEIKQAFGIVLISSLINIPLSLIGVIFFTTQRVHIENLFNVLPPILTFILLLITVTIKLNIAEYCLYWSFILIAVSGSKIVYHLLSRKKLILFSEDNEAQASIPIPKKEFFLTSFRFFLINIVNIIVWNIDGFIISHFINLASVSSFSITFRLVTLASTIFGIINGSIFPIFLQEYSKNNWEWITRKYNEIIDTQIFLAIIIWLGTFAFGEMVLNLWTGKPIYAGDVTMWFLGGYMVLITLVTFNNSFVIYFNYVKGTMLFGLLEAVLKLVFSIFLIKVLDLSGMAMAAFLSSLLSTFIIVPEILRRRSMGRLKFFTKNRIKILMFNLALLSVFLLLSIVWGSELKILLGCLIIASYVLFLEYKFRYVSKTLCNYIK